MGSNPVGITSKAPSSRRLFYCIPPLRHTNIIILDKYNDKLRLYNNLIHLKSFPPILLEKHYRPTTGNSICSTHPCNYRNWSILKKNRIRLSKRRSQRKQRTFTYHGSAGRGKKELKQIRPCPLLASSLQKTGRSRKFLKANIHNYVRLFVSLTSS